MDNDILLKVDPNLTFCINTQIKEQLKWLIGIEKNQNRRDASSRKPDGGLIRH